MRLAEVARQAHELRGAIVLDLVDHDVARVAHATTDERELEVEPLDGTQVFRAGQAHANGVETQPATLSDLVFDACIAPAAEAFGIAHELGFVHVADDETFSPKHSICSASDMSLHHDPGTSRSFARRLMRCSRRSRRSSMTSALRCEPVGRFLSLLHAPCA